MIFLFNFAPNYDTIIIKYAHEETILYQSGLAFLGRNGL